MFAKSSRIRKRAMATAPLAAALLLNLCATVPAHAIYIWSHTDSDGFKTVDYLDKNGNLLISFFYGPEGEYFGYKDHRGDPSPDGQDTGLGPSRDEINQLAERLKNMGGSLELEPDFWATPLGESLTEDGKGPAVTDPWDFGAMSFEEEGAGGFGGGGGGGYNSGGIGEMIDRKKRTGGGRNDDDDDDDDGGGDTGTDPQDLWGGASNDPDLVNPPPIPSAMVLLPPDATGHSTAGAGSTAASSDPQPIPWAPFGAGITAVPPDPVRVITDGR